MCAVMASMCIGIGVGVVRCHKLLCHTVLTSQEKVMIQSLSMGELS